MKVYNVYIEGYADNGGKCGARYLGEYVGKDFVDAAKKACVNNFGEQDTKRCFKTQNGKPTFWGCGLYDNYDDAAKYFG